MQSVDTTQVDPLDLPAPERWEPWKNRAQPHVIRGRITRKYARRSDFDGENKYFVDVLTDDGEHWYLSGYSTRVHQELGRANPQVGDRIGVKYLGIVEREGMKPYPDITLVDYDRQATSVQFTDDDEPESPPASDVPGDAGEFGPPNPATDDAREGGDDDLPF